MKSYKEFKEGFAHPNHKKLDANNNGKLDADDFKLLRKKKQSTKEDCSMKEDLEEMDLSFIKGAKPRGSVADQKAARDALIAKRKETNPNPPQLGSSSSDKYKLGDYDKKSNRSYSEEVEQIDELSKKTLGSYVKKATSDVGLAGFVKGTTVNDHSRSKDYDDAAAMNKKRKVGIAKAVDKLTKESIELDEKLDPSMGAGEYVKDFKKSDAPQFKGKSPEKRRIMGVAAFLDAQRKIKEEVELDEKELQVSEHLGDYLGRKLGVKVTQGEPNMKHAPKWASTAKQTPEGAWHWVEKDGPTETPDSNSYFPHSGKTKFTGFVSKQKKQADDENTKLQKNRAIKKPILPKGVKEEVELDEGNFEKNMDTIKSGKLPPHIQAILDKRGAKGNDAIMAKGRAEKLKNMKEMLDEARAKKEPAQVYHPTYSSAVQHARANAEKQGYTVSDDDWFHHVNSGPGKPSGGKTTRHVIPLQKDGKPSKKALAIQVHDRQTDKNSYELNSYIN